MSRSKWERFRDSARALVRVSAGSRQKSLLRFPRRANRQGARCHRRECNLRSAIDAS